MNLIVHLEMVGLRIQSLSAGNTDWNRTEMILNDAHYDGATYYFEVIATNTDSSDRTAKLVDSGGTVYATVTIPTGTSNPTRLRSASFTPNSGATTYKVRIEQTTSSAQILCYYARIVVKQVSATLTRIQIPMVAQDATGTSQTSFITRTNGTSFTEVASEYWRYWTKVAGAYGATIDGWALEVCMRESAGGIAEAELFNQTDSTQVAAVTVSGSTVAVNQATFANGATNFDAGDVFQLRIRRNSGFSFAEISRGCIYVRISDLDTAAVPLQVMHYNADVNVTTIYGQSRILYDPSEFSNVDSETFEVQADLDSGTSFEISLRNDGTNDSGTGGSDVAGSGLTVSGARSTQTADVTGLTAARYIVHAVESGTSILDLTVVTLWISATGSSTPQLGTSEAFGLSDSARMVVYSVKRLSASEALGVGEPGKQAVDFGFMALPGVSEAFGLSDEPQAPAGQPYLSASEALGIVDEPGSPLSGPAYSARTLTIAEIALSQGSRYAASKGVRHPDRFYRGIVKQWGSIVRSFPMPTGIPQIGEAVVEVVDDDGELRRLFGESDPRNSTVILKDGPEGGSYSLFQTIYTGDISDVEFLPGMQRISLLDKSWRWLDEQIPKLLVRRIFDDALLGRNVREKREGAYREEEVFSPIVIGIVPAGSVNAVRLSDTRFNLCRHAVPHSQIALLGRGPDDEDFTSVSATITEEVKLIDGIQYRLTHADFSTPQDERFELRWGGHGMTDTGLNTGTVIQTPAEGFEAFLLRIANRTADQINDASFKSAATYMAAIDTGGPVAGLYVAGSITEALTYGEAATRYLRSFGLAMYLDKQGRISIRMVTDQPETLTDLDDLQDILEKSESHRLANPVYSKIDYQFARNNASGEWGETGTESNANALAQLKRPANFTLPLWFVADPFTATWVVLDLVQWTDPTARRMKFSVPGHRHMPVVELAKWFGVTNWSAPGTGYFGQPILINGIRYDVDGRRLELEAITRLQPQAGQGAVKGNPSLDARVGPHYFAHGKFFAVLKDRNDETVLNVMASSDWGQNFTVADAAGAPVFGSGNRILAHDSVTDRALSTRILIVTQTLDGVVELHAFDMSLRQWEFVNRIVWASVSGFENIEFGNSEPQFMAQVERSRGAKSRIGVFFFRESDPNLSGQFGGLRGRTAWAYSDDNGLTWSSPVDVGKDVDLQSRYGELYSYQGGRIYAGDGDRFHFFYTRLPGDLTRNTPDAFHRTALDSGSLSAETKWILTDLSTFTVPSPYHFGVAALQYEENEEGELEPWLYVPFNGALNGNWIRVQSGDGLESGPTWKGNHFTAGNVILVDAGQGNTNAPQMAMQSVRGAIHFMGAHHLGLTFKSYSFHNTTGNSTSDRIGPHYNVLLGPQHAGFLILDLAGRLWIATLQTSRTVDYEFYFTFWPLSDLPRDAAFDTTAIEALITAPE